MNTARFSNVKSFLVDGAVLQYCAKVMKPKFAEFRPLFLGKFALNAFKVSVDHTKWGRNARKNPA